MCQTLASVSPTRLSHLVIAVLLTACADLSVAPADSVSADVVDTADVTADTTPEGTVEPIPVPPLSLIDPDLFVRVVGKEDPFDAEIVPGMSACDDEDYKAVVLSDKRVYQVETATCHHITAEQSSRRSVTAGESLSLFTGHSTLYDTTGLYRVVVMLGDDVLYTNEVEAPLPIYGSYMEEVVAPTDAPAGTPVTFHLALFPPEPMAPANKPSGALGHGDSTWWMIGLSKLPDAPLNSQARDREDRQ